MHRSYVYDGSHPLIHNSNYKQLRRLMMNIGEHKLQVHIGNECNNHYYRL